ncbi:MAG TPA: CopD family protein, partial [Jatrophihabitans sp.]|nr:CopD family protein [Jatrophihabitans sp.]
GIGFERLLSGAYGLHWTTRELGFVLLLGAALLAQRLPRPIRACLAVTGAALAGVGSALLGHAAAASAPTRTIADALHLVAAATWAGALVVLAVMILRRPADGSRLPARAVFRAFGVPAALCVSVVVVSGVYLASDVVGSVDAALLTTYGRVLLLKVVLFAVAGLLGLSHALRLRVRSIRARTLLAETSLAVLVLGLAAVLTSGQPATEPQLVAARQPTPSQFADGRAGDLQERITLGPNQPGRSVAVIDVLNTRRPAPAPIQDVLVSIGDPGAPTPPGVLARRSPEGHWYAAITLPAAGKQSIVVTVRRPGMKPVTGRYDWVVAAPATHQRPAVVSTAPIGAALRWGALVLALLSALAWMSALGASQVRRSRQRRQASAASVADDGRLDDLQLEHAHLGNAADGADGAQASGARIRSGART